MDIQESLKIIRALANGMNPDTGETLEEGSVCRQPQAVKALNRAISALTQQEQREQNKPANAYRAWTRAEEAQVCEEIRKGTPLDDIAKGHNRTVAALAVRLVKLGKIAASASSSDELESPLEAKPASERRVKDDFELNSYEPWTTEEDQQLVKEFHNAVDFKEMAHLHGRSKGAIVSRLVKLGKIKPKNAQSVAA